jgi:uncharacterized membrane protein YesL
MARDEESYITRTFFTSFKQDFFKSTIIGLIMIGLGAALAVDGYIMYRLCFTSVFWTLVSAVLIIAAVAYIIVLLWIFQLQAHFVNTIINMFKNSIMIGMRFIFCTITMAFVFVAMGLLIYYVCTPAIIFGVGTCTYFCSMLAKNILIQCESQEF